MSLTWAEFEGQVTAYLHNYTSVAAATALIDVFIPAGAEDLQRTIEYYQTGHKDNFASGDLTTEGFVQLGTAPLGRIRSVRMVKYDTTNGVAEPNIFRSLRQVAWRQVPAMRGGELSAFTGMIAIDQTTRSFAITPPLNSETRLVMEWVGVKSAFEDTDEVPFDSRAAEAVGLYVLSKLSRVIDRDLQQANSYYQSYVQLKRQLISETRWAAVVDEPVESQLSGDDTYTESLTNTTMALFTYRPDISTLTGGGATALDGLVTVGGGALTGTVLFLVISGVPQYWRLVDGTDATDIDAGIVRPADYNASTNARVWAQLS